MNWLKIAAVIIGALIAFYIVGNVIHIITALLGVIVVLAVLVAGGYVAYKVVTSRKSPGGPATGPGATAAVSRDREPTTTGSRTTPPPGFPPARRANVDDELDRLRREMGG